MHGAQARVRELAVKLTERDRRLDEAQKPMLKSIDDLLSAMA